MSGCNGEVVSVRGRKVAVTGKIYLNGEQIFRPQILEKLTLLGAMTSNDRSRSVNLLIEGEQNLAHVKDSLGRSRKSKSAESNDSRGYGTCIVDGRNFRDLVLGIPVACKIHAAR